MGDLLLLSDGVGASILQNVPSFSLSEPQEKQSSAFFSTTQINAENTITGMDESW
jgi:hypothetical protein